MKQFRTMRIYGRVIQTNLERRYIVRDAKPTATMSVKHKSDFESPRQFVERLAVEGYKHITLRLREYGRKKELKMYALVR